MMSGEDREYQRKDLINSAVIIKLTILGIVIAVVGVVVSVFGLNINFDPSIEGLNEAKLISASEKMSSKNDASAAQSTDVSKNTFEIEFNDSLIKLNSPMQNRIKSMFSRFGFKAKSAGVSRAYKIMINTSNSGYHRAGDLVTSVLNIDVSVIANKDETVVFSDSISVSGGGVDVSNAKRNLMNLALKKFEATYDGQLREILE